MEDKEQQNIDDVEKLEAFANSKSKVYAFPPATNIDDLAEHPFMRFLSASGNQQAKKIFLGEDNQLSVAKADGKTKLSSFVSSLEQRFAELNPNSAIILIDPDVIKQFANLSREDEVDVAWHNIYGKVASFVDKNPEFAGVKLSGQTISDMAQNAVGGDFPDTFSIKLDNKKRLSIIVLGDVNKSMSQKLSSMFDKDVCINKNLGITREEFTDAIIFHEIAHGLSDECGRDPNDGEDFLDIRHKEEGLADVFSTLSMIKHHGNHKFARALGDIRAISFNNAIKEIGSVENADNSMAYFTTYLIDKAIGYGDKLKKSGELEKLSDKELFALSEKFIDENVIPASKIRTTAKGLLGDANDGSKAFVLRFNKAEMSLLSDDASNTNSGSNSLWMGKLYKDLAQTNEDDDKIDVVFNKVIDDIRQEKVTGGNNQFAELDEVRKYITYSYQDAVEYNEFASSIKASASNLSVNIKPEKLISEFKQKYQSTLDYSLKFTDDSSDSSSFNNAILSEAYSQKIASMIVQNKTLAKELDKEPEMKNIVEAKADNCPATWLWKISKAKKENYTPEQATIRDIKRDKDFFEMKNQDENSWAQQQDASLAKLYKSRNRD